MTVPGKRFVHIYPEQFEGADSFNLTCFVQSGGKLEISVWPMIIPLVFPEFTTMSFSWVHSVSASTYCCIKDWLRQRISVNVVSSTNLCILQLVFKSSTSNRNSNNPSSDP